MVFNLISIILTIAWWIYVLFHVPAIVLNSVGIVELFMSILITLVLLVVPFIFTKL